MYTIGQDGYLIKLSGSNSKEFLEHTDFHAKENKMIIHSLFKVIHVFQLDCVTTNSSM